MTKRSKVVSNVSKLPREFGELVERMLVEGATFEDVVEALKERGGSEITLPAVESYFRSNLALQQKRIQRQLQAAQALKKAIGDPRSAQAELADAVMLTGLTRVNRSDAEYDFRDAMKEHYQRENLRLKQEVVDMKREKLQVDGQLARMRIRNELAKWKLAQERIVALHRQVQANGKNARLGPETLQKIQEIYGLVPQSAKRAAAGA